MPRYNPAPGWPAGPAGWLPPRGWRPQPEWAPAPDGWQLVLPSDGELVEDPASGKRRDQEVREWTAATADRYEVVSVAPSYGRPDPVRVGSRRPLNSLSRTALILGVLVAPVGLVLSVFALLKVNPARERGRAWAVAGLLIALPVTLFWWGILQATTSGS